METFFDAYRTDGEKTVFCYRSGLAVYEETFYNGVLVSSGYNASGYPLGLLQLCPSRLEPKDFHEPSSFNIEIDGQSIDYRLKLIDFETAKGKDSLESVITLESEIKPVRLKIHTVIDGTQMFSRYIEIENLSDENIKLSRLVLLGGGIEETNRRHYGHGNDIGKIYSVGYFDSDKWGREGEFAWHDLTPDELTVKTRFGRDRFRHPVMFIRNNLSGMMYFSQIGWSGGCSFSVDHHADYERSDSLLSFKAEITAHNPLTVIPPKSAFVTPEVYMGAVTGGLDEAVNEMHSHIRKSVLNMPEASPEKCLVGAGMGAEHDMSVETTKAYAKQFAEMGAEVFIVDAGWVCPPSKQAQWGDYNGTNIPDPERYSDGLSEISDYCRSLGMKFGLWVDIENLGAKSPVYEEHPEWREKTVFGIQSENLADFSKPEVAQWAENELARIIEEYKLDLLRVDHNVSYRDYFTMADAGTGVTECLSLRHHQAVYRMYENLKKRFPHVIFENCAGGGARTDLGMMKNFNHTWVSDCQQAPRSLTVTNGMTMALPPERVDRLFAGMGCHEHGTLDLQMRNTMLTHMTLNVIAPANVQPNKASMDFVKHSVKVYKNFIRPFLPKAKIFHHTPGAGLLNSDFYALEIASPDGSRDAMAVFSLPSSQNRRYTALPKGINAEHTYKVTLDNSGASYTAKGSDLIVNGIPVSLSCPLSSELILFEKTS
ncbi:MAG: alpha-galactosidase [Ruminococcaceae bacterium]|nr:alpha-galactosidase [Oscillospiraceae bacterium]